MSDQPKPKGRPRSEVEKTYVTFYVPVPDQQKLAQIAKARETSVSSLCAHIVRRILERSE